MIYKNMSISTKTFYGVVFNPGDMKEVPGFINDGQFIEVDASELQKTSITKQSSKAASKPDKAVPEKKETPKKEAALNTDKAAKSSEKQPEATSNEESKENLKPTKGENSNGENSNK